jgi:hypothetical protein
MEVVLLWLDDLDDLLFSGALEWDRLRRAALQVGLCGAVGLASCELLFAAARLTPEFAAVASASVSLWLFGAACAGLRKLQETVARATA